MNRLGLIAALPISLMASFAVAEPDSQNMAARTELHAIDTLTLSDAQFLSGDANGRATLTAAQLRIPIGSGRLPVVVLQHGSGGMAANIEMWARELNAMGVSTFALDGFTGRGLTQVNTDQDLSGCQGSIDSIERNQGQVDRGGARFLDCDPGRHAGLPGLGQHPDFLSAELCQLGDLLPGHDKGHGEDRCRRRQVITDDARIQGRCSVGRRAPGRRTGRRSSIREITPRRRNRTSRPHHQERTCPNPSGVFKRLVPHHTDDPPSTPASAGLFGSGITHVPPSKPYQLSACPAPCRKRSLSRARSNQYITACQLTTALAPGGRIPAWTRCRALGTKFDLAQTRAGAHIDDGGS
jgi:hypothetical protein